MPIAFFCLAAWHAWAHLVQGAVMMLGFGLALAIAPVPGFALAAPAILSGVLMLAAERMRRGRAEQTEIGVV